MERPQDTNRGLALLYIAIVVAALRFTFQFDRTTAEFVNLGVPRELLAQMAALYFGLAALNVYLIGRRRNWVRHLYCICLVISAFWGFGSKLESLQTLFELGGSFFLYRPESSEWFKEKNI